MAIDLFAGMGGFTFGSVCSGIEAASVAWHPLGWRAEWLAEIEPFPSAVLAHHYPDVPNLGDMTALPELVRSGAIHAPDVLAGGTPCQAFSVAGLRGGLSDKRGALTLSFVELANAIDSQRPGAECVIVWENVPGVLSSKDNAFGCFLAGLAGEDDPLEPPGGRWADAGYVHGPQRAVAWRVLDAQYFGLAQRRRRVFVVASARAGFDPAEVLFEFDGVRRDSAPSRESWEEIAGTLASRTAGGGFPGTDEACSGYLQPVAARSVALRGREGGATAELGDDVAGCLRASSCGGDKPHVLAPVAFVQNTRNEVRLMGGDGQIVGSLAAEAGMKQQCYVLAPACYPLLEVGKRTGKSTTDPRAGLGIGGDHDPMYTLQAGAQHGVCVTGDITHTLKGEGLDGSEDGTGRGQPIVAFTTEQTPKHNNDCALTLTKQSPTGGGQIQSVMVGSAVRRLTPRECEFLQGFPRGYTAIPWRKKPAEDCPDGPRYKALGNSMAVPCMRWIGERIERHLKEIAQPKKYGVVYADPPWSYTDKCNSGNRGAGHKYKTMTDAELAALPVAGIAADDCALFMWATFPRLGAAIQLMADWGFTYKTCAFVWVKKSEAGKLAWGMGNWTRANAEIVLLGIKGRPKRIDCGVHQIIEAPRREHSRKPDEVRDRIVALMGAVPRIELFARQSAPGWDSWGNESTKFDEEEA